MKKIMSIFFYTILLSLNAYAQAEQFIYPVAVLQDQLLVIHQKDINDIELLIWDPKTTFTTKAILSFFSPSHIQAIPHSTAFSFLDRGRVRIKDLAKRTPKTVDIFEPINSISSIKWLNEDQFYFVGKDFDSYDIFLCDLSQGASKIFRLSAGDDFDYLYPTKIDNNIFCIKRDQHYNHNVVRITWNPKPYQFDEVPVEKEVIFKATEPICFLYMQNKHEGFFLQYPQLTSDHEVLTFTCHHFAKLKEEWEVEQLFSFSLPTRFFIGSRKSRVYESIAPFLPRYNRQGIIYYVTCDQNHTCQVKLYDVIQHQSKSLPLQHHRYSLEKLQCFAPCIMGDKIYCGIILDSKKQARSIIDESPEIGSVQIDLPFFSIG